MIPGSLKNPCLQAPPPEVRQHGPPPITPRRRRIDGPEDDSDSLGGIFQRTRALSDPARRSRFQAGPRRSARCVDADSDDAARVRPETQTGLRRVGPRPLASVTGRDSDPGCSSELPGRGYGIDGRVRAFSQGVVRNCTSAEFAGRKRSPRKPPPPLGFLPPRPPLRPPGPARPPPLRSDSEVFSRPVREVRDQPDGERARRHVSATAESAQAAGPGAAGSEPRGASMYAPLPLASGLEPGVLQYRTPGSGLSRLWPSAGAQGSADRRAGGRGRQ